jgi:branched-chain amino acid transport system substrate-binding protein
MQSMTGWITSALAVAALCVAPLAHAQSIALGAVLSESGSHAADAGEYRKGLVLWQEEVNRAGGLIGRQVELRFADDGSEAVRAGRESARLIGEGVQVLFGPYGSAATLAAAAEAEAARRVLLNVAGPSAQVHRRAPRYVFQTSAPYAAHAEGVLQLARQVGARSLFILARDDGASREMAEAAQQQAKSRGLAAQLEIFSAGTTDFLPQLYKAIGAQADAWIAFVQPRDAGEMVKTLKRQGYVPRLLYVRSSTDPRFIERVGQDAEFVLGSREYDARFPTPGNPAFVQAFNTRWGAPPGSLAAAGYAAGTVLAEAVRRAGSAEAEKLRPVLAEMQCDTVLGAYRVDPSSGTQAGIRPALTQIVRGRSQIVWPEALARERPLLAFAPWSDRQVLR